MASPVKKSFIIGLTIGLTISGISAVFANSQIQAILNDQVKVTLNGQVQVFKDEATNEIQYPITYKDRTYLPLRAIADLVDVDISYDVNSNTVILENCQAGTIDRRDVLPADLKPIIYLYPEKETKLSVKLGNEENVTCSYPEYKNGWDVIANPNGTLIDVNTGRKLYSLYWEGIHTEPINFEEGFVVKKSDTINFLEEKLAILGLNEFEAEEFIVYWLPKLQENEYNYIRFATLDEINKNMPLEFSVHPDTVIRVFMQYKALNNYIEVKEQTLENTPERIGFVALEWGGTEIK